MHGQFMAVPNLHHLQPSGCSLGECSQAQGNQNLEIMSVVMNPSEKVSSL